MRLLNTIIVVIVSANCFANPFVSKVWVADNSDGTYKNPIIYADYSDPDVCRVGNDFYMTASSFNCVPGLPILHSKDLVNWELISHALPRLAPDSVFSTVRHGWGVWAPSIRFHNGEFYIYWGDPDFGFYMVKSKDPKGEWTKPILVKKSKGLIDCCPFWDEDGTAYLSHGFAGSRAGEKSIIAVSKLSSDGTHTVGDTRIVFDGHENHPTVEGTKLYKRNGYYYIFVPAGGVATGWQLVLRSKDIFGPYDEKIVLAQGKTDVNGPHQGAWVDTPMGEDWFIHFQDVETCGRIIHLQPMSWKNDWPIMGQNVDKNGCGEPVRIYKKPKVATNVPIQTIVDDDDFNSNTIGLQWQWHSNPDNVWAFAHQKKDCLRLYSVYTKEKKNLWNVSNLLLQKTPAPDFDATTKITVTPDKRYVGERFSFVMMGESYATLTIENKIDGLYLNQIQCQKAKKGTAEEVKESVKLEKSTVYLRIQMKNGKDCIFFYSVDGKNYKSIGTSFSAVQGQWIGAKIGYVAERPKKSNDGGYMDIDFIHFTPIKN